MNPYGYAIIAILVIVFEFRQFKMRPRQQSAMSAAVEASERLARCSPKPRRLIKRRGIA